MPLVAGIDSSTQACKVVIRDLDSGALVREGRAAHPAGSEVDPDDWWRAFELACAGAGGLDDVAAISVTARYTASRTRPRRPRISRARASRACSAGSPTASTRSPRTACARGACC